MDTNEEQAKDPSDKQQKLIRILGDTSRMLHPTNFKIMLSQSQEMRTRMMECAALGAIFSAREISNALRPHVSHISADEARKMIQNKDFQDEVLTLDDGRAMALIGSEARKMRYELMRTVDSSLRKFRYERIKTQVRELGEYTLTQNEEESFHLIMEETCDLENIARSVVTQPDLRRLPHVRKALKQKHSLRMVFSLRTPSFEIVDQLESAWSLEPSTQ